MLTIKSNFINFKDRQGQEYSYGDLETLSAALIKSDLINFKGEISRGFTEDIANKVIEKITIGPERKAIIINDLSLVMANKLLEKGFRKENIYLAFGKWTKEAKPSKDLSTYYLIKEFISANIREDLNVITLEEMFKLGLIKTDLIIANPPYGKIGANITKKIIDEVDFDEYVNLLPANDYKRNTDKNLFNYQSDMEAINNGFKDAAVTTHLAKIHKAKVNNMTVDEFERSQYIDRSLDKYFRVTRARTHYAIDAAGWVGWKHEYVNTISPNNTFTIWQRDVSHGHMPYTKKCISYRWNVLKELTIEWFEQNCINTQGISNGAFLTFKTITEKENFTNWFYSKDGFKFISKVFTALNVNSGVYSLYRILPKVDWTRSWTVEEILKDYRYTDAEIKEVMDDLVNFKGMDD